MSPAREEIRSPVRDSAQARPIVRAKIGATPWRFILGVVAAALFLGAGWRWAGALTTEPASVTGVDGPAVVLVAQAGDCPERTAAMHRWLANARAQQPRGDPSLQVAMLRDESPATNSPLAQLSILAAEDASRVERALLRSGVEATPALLLLDAGGRPVLGAAFTQEGPEPELFEALRFLGTLTTENRIPRADPIRRSEPPPDQG